jgi:phosphate transport system ATP-binding protein
MIDRTFTVSPMAAGPPCCDPEPLIRVRDLSLTYGDETVLANVSLTINRGCVTALIGPSGCGKTSFLSSINRLTDMLPGCRVNGQIQIGDLDVHAPGVNVMALRRQVGMIFQRPNPFPLSVRGNIELPLREHGVKRSERAAMWASGRRSATVSMRQYRSSLAVSNSASVSRVPSPCARRFCF